MGTMLKNVDSIKKRDKTVNGITFAGRGVVHKDFTTLSQSVEIQLASVVQKPT
jgi:hypothetical protein